MRIVCVDHLAMISSAIKCQVSPGGQPTIHYPEEWRSWGVLLSQEYKKLPHSGSFIQTKALCRMTDFFLYYGRPWASHFYHTYPFFICKMRIVIYILEYCDDHIMCGIATWK
jgi:hypothetical protein